MIFIPISYSKITTSFRDESVESTFLLWYPDNDSFLGLYQHAHDEGRNTKCNQVLWASLNEESRIFLSLIIIKTILIEKLGILKFKNSEPF